MNLLACPGFDFDLGIDWTSVFQTAHTIGAIVVSLAAVGAMATTAFLVFAVIVRRREMKRERGF